MEHETKREKIEISALGVGQGMRRHSFDYALRFMESAQIKENL